MSQTGAIKTAVVGARERRLGVLHRQGAWWRLLVVELNGMLRIVDSISIAYDDVGAVRAALARHNALRLIRILPASAVVCRVIEAPGGENADTSAALGLIAEASLPANIPAHRRAAGLLGASDSIRRQAVLIGWPGASPEPALGAPGIEETWTAEPVALLGLLRAPGGGFASYAESATGSIGVVALEGSKVVLRALRESAADGGAWGALVGERIAQTMAGAGIEKSETESFGALTLDAASRRGLGDVPSLAEYGVALGAASAFARARPLSRALFSLTSVAAIEERTALARFAEWSRSPAHALGVIAACAALCLLTPLAFAAARHAVLVAKSGGLAQQQEAERAAAMMSAFQDQLEKRRLPMTKLLADVSGALPPGIVVESLRLEMGQRIGLHGSAESLDLVNQLQARLNDSGVFAEAAVDRTQSPESRPGIDFDVSARLVRPYAKAKGVEDYAALTLAQRLYGERASIAASAPDTIERPRAARAAGEGPARPRERAPAASAKAADIPAPIADDAIARLDANAAMKEWTTRQKASKQSGIDSATRDRLKDEAEKAKARMQAARQEAKP